MRIKASQGPRGPRGQALGFASAAENEDTITRF